MTEAPRRWLHALVAAVVLLGWPTLARAQTAGQVAVLLPLSGDYEPIGRQMLESLQLAFDDHPGISWRVVDSAGDPATAAHQVEELARNPSNLAILGPIGAAESRAAAEAAQTAAIPLLALTSEAGIERAGPWVFRLRVSPQEQARFMARVAIHELELSRIAVLCPDDHYGRSASRAFVDEVLGGGGRITGLEVYVVDDNDFNDPLERLIDRRRPVLAGRAFNQQPGVRYRLRAAGQGDFEAIFVPDEARRLALLLAFLSFWNIPVGDGVQLLGTSSGSGRELGLNGSLATGALFSQVFHDTMEGVSIRRFTTAFEAAYGRRPSEAEAQGYDAAAWLARLVIERPQGRSDRAALQRELSGGSPHAGLTGELHFDAEGAVVRPLALFAADSSGLVSPYFLLR